MNAAFAWFGLTLVVGALAYGTRRLPGRSGRAATALWCLAGAGSIGVGLFPVVEDPTMHAVVAWPIFVAQPLALLLTAVSVWATRRRVAMLLGVLTVASTVGSIGFGLRVGDDTSFIGAFERLALWTGYLGVCVVAVGSFASRHAQDRTRRQVQ
jgi:hypothetical membrane protein